MDRNKNFERQGALYRPIPWDPSVQALSVTPDFSSVSSTPLTTDITPFLAQQSDVMDAVQRMRGKAER